MGELHFYVAETAPPQGAGARIVIKDEITQEELAQLNSAFRVCSLYHSITQIKDIVVENGESFKRFMSSQNLLNIRQSNTPPERAIMLANKAVLNYASSIITDTVIDTIVSITVSAFLCLFCRNCGEMGFIIAFSVHIARVLL